MNIFFYLPKDRLSFKNRPSLKKRDDKFGEQVNDWRLEAFKKQWVCQKEGTNSWGITGRLKEVSNR